MSKMPKKQTLEHTAQNAAQHAAQKAAQDRPTPAVDLELGDESVDVASVDDAGNDGEGDGMLGRAKRFKEVWLVEDRKNARSIWTRVGAAFENADGSWNIRLSAVPLGGRLNVRDPLPRERPVTA